jgi:hypothetical protein
MQRDPFVRYRPGRSIGESTTRVVMRNMLEAGLVLHARSWWGGRMLLDERFAPHDEAEAEHRNRSTPNAMMEDATQCAVISTSGL